MLRALKLIFWTQRAQSADTEFTEIKTLKKTEAGFSSVHSVSALRLGSVTTSKNFTLQSTRVASCAEEGCVEHFSRERARRRATGLVKMEGLT
jgi:hypothetical protein